MAKVTGSVSVADLPPHLGIMASLCFFEVSGPEDARPDPESLPPEESDDVHLLAKEVDLEKTARRVAFIKPFEIEHKPGFFYIQLRVVLFRDSGKGVVAQVEPFFFNRRPLHVEESPQPPVLFSVSWPPTPLDRLHRHGRIRPNPSS